MVQANGSHAPSFKEAELYYLNAPTRSRPVAKKIEFLSVTELLEDEETCREIWDLLCSQFKTRSKLLAIWPSVRFVALCGRGAELAGFLLVSTPLNWQIDYVVVRPTRRREGIAADLVNETVNQALRRKVPYVTLTSLERLRPLYEGACGFAVVGGSAARNGDVHRSALPAPGTAYAVFLAGD